MALLVDRGEDLREANTTLGKFRMWRLGPTVYATELSGHMGDNHVDLFVEYSEGLIHAAPGKLYVFHEWTRMTGYDTSCRTRITSWTLAHRNSYAEVHVAFRSKLVAMGVQVANLALGGLVKGYSDAASLQVALRATLTAEQRGKSFSIPPR